MASSSRYALNTWARQVALVAKTTEKAERLVTALGLEGKVYPVGAGDALAGRRFDKIILVHFVDHPTFHQWVSTSLRTKLSPNGEWVDLS